MSQRRYVANSIREYVFARDSHRCRYCGKHESEVEDTYSWLPAISRVMHVDHVWPYRFGGPTEWWNLVAACPDCNLSKQHRSYNERLIHENLSHLDMLGELLEAA